MLCSQCLIDRRGRGTASNMKWVEKPSNVNFMDAGKVVEVPISLIYYSKLHHLICIEIPPPVHSLPIFCVIWLQVGKGREKKKKCLWPMKLPHNQCKVTTSNVGQHTIMPPAVTVCHFPPPFSSFHLSVSFTSSWYLHLLPLSSSTSVPHSLQHVGEIL